MKTTVIRLDVATFDQYKIWANEAEQLVNLEHSYSFSIDPSLPYSGIMVNGGIIIKHMYSSRHGFLATYLHEIAHIICSSAGLDFSPDSRHHSRYFACLLFLMYRRAGIIDQLSVYDFGDTMYRENGKLPYMHEFQRAELDDDGWPSDSQLIDRFTFAVQRSRQLDRPGLSIERAALLLKADLQAEWEAYSSASPSVAAAGPFRRLWGILLAR